MTIPPKWLDALELYLASERAAGRPATTQRTRRDHLGHLGRRIGVDPFEVTAEELVAFAAAQEWSPSTRRSRRTTFQSFYRWAVATARIERDPSVALMKVKQPRPRPRPVPARIYHEALLRADPLERVWMELAYDHGLRRGECALVHSSDVVEDLVGHSLVVHGKGDKDRIVPLSPRMARTLLELDGWLAPGDEEGHISARWLGKRVNRLLEGDWTIHSLRHAAGTKFNRHGGLLVAQKLLGHESVATTQVYCYVPDDSLRATVLATAS